MRDLSASMQAKLASGLTTFCHCWLLQRTDGVKLGFTDHDEDLTFDGVTYERLAGMTASIVAGTCESRSARRFSTRALSASKSYFINAASRR